MTENNYNMFNQNLIDCQICNICENSSTLSKIKKALCLVRDYKIFVYIWNGYLIKLWRNREISPAIIEFNQPMK